MTIQSETQGFGTSFHLRCITTWWVHLVHTWSTPQPIQHNLWRPCYVRHNVICFPMPTATFALPIYRIKKMSPKCLHPNHTVPMASQCACDLPIMYFQTAVSILGLLLAWFQSSHTEITAAICAWVVYYLSMFQMPHHGVNNFDILLSMCLSGVMAYVENKHEKQ